MKDRIPHSKILCCASIFALSLAACSHGEKIKTENLADNGASASTNKLVKLKKGHRSKKLGLALPDPRSYDNLWDRLFDRFDLPAVDHPDVDREFNWFLNHPTYIERVQSRAEPFLYSIVKQLEKQNLPGELALLPVIESAFQPHVVSPAHAAGIWQFIPATGRHYGLKTSHSYDGRRDIYASTRAAIKYLKKLRNDFNGDWLLAIAGYNCGEGAVSRAIQRNLARGLPTDFWSLDLPQETRSYVPRLLAVARLFSDSEQYGVELRPIPNQALYKTVKMNDQVDLALAANAADISLDRLLELNPGFKRQQVDLDGSYRLFIPAHKKIVDFKEELARQIASSQGYSERDAQASAAPVETRLASTAAAIIDAAPVPAEEKPAVVESAATDPLAPTPDPVENPTSAVDAAAEPIAPPPVPEERPEASASFVAEPTAPTPPPTLENARFAPSLQSVEPPPLDASATSAPSTDETLASAASETPEWVPRRTRRSYDESLAEPALKVTDYERAVVASSSKPPAKTLPKAVQKNREEPPPPAAEKRPKAAEREAPVAREEPVSPRAGQKATQKPRDEEPPAGKRQPEPDNSGKKTAYVVQEGDTVYSIARKHDMDVDDLKKMNRLADADDIKWGRRLTVLGADASKKLPAAKAGAGIKPTQSSKYTARDGETLFSISRRFNVTVADLRKWNGIKEDRQFRAGMNITVSGEKD